MGIEAVGELVRFAVRTRLVDIPDDITEFVKGLILKTVAGMLAGSSMPAGRKVAEFVREVGGLPEVGVIGCGLRVPLWQAVFADAFLAHASELEDDRFRSGTSWDITVVPVILPLAEKLKLSGEDIVEASAVGLEVLSRTSQFFPQGHMGLTVVPGSVGPAATAARALRLDEGQTRSAFGLAMSGVPVSYLNFGTDAHYFETALQSLNGLVAAELSKHGMSSNPDIVAYLARLLGEDRVDAKKIVDGLGVQWQLRDIWVKKYPCCFYTHRYIDALLGVMKEEDIPSGQIESVTVHVAEGAAEICNRPEPQSLGDLQFSFHHALAAAMLDKDVNFSHFTEDKIPEPRFKEARSKVKVVIHPEWASTFAMDTPAHIVVRLSGGRELLREKRYPLGSREEPLTKVEFRRLFHKFVSGILEPQQAEYAADALSNLEQLTKEEVENFIKTITVVDTFV
ncbi:MAG TPA: hypothetical protein EYP71_04340 [Dehalococcoidia bacterium]|nr:hypothetical protein [Dehalococcoidia bacterium]